jgi:archaellum biogenesis protein FlaJ (TadC family)
MVTLKFAGVGGGAVSSATNSNLAAWVAPAQIDYERSSESEVSCRVESAARTKETETRRELCQWCEIMGNLYTKTLFSLVALTVVMGLLLFLPAGTIQYWQAWTYLGIFTGASLLVSLYLLKKDPALLKRRMRGGPTAEKEATQKIIMLFASLGFIALLVLPALDYRLGWSAVPPSVTIAGDILVAIGFYFHFSRVQGEYIRVSDHCSS